MEHVKKLICPKCSKKFALTEENKNFLPFCQKVCKMVDLGKWLNEKYVVEGEESTSPPKKTDEE